MKDSFDSGETKALMGATEDDGWHSAILFLFECLTLGYPFLSLSWDKCPHLPNKQVGLEQGSANFLPKGKIVNILDHIVCVATT